MNVAILGFGTIGSGVYEIIQNRKSTMLTDTRVVKVLDLPINKDKLDIIVCDIKDIVDDPSIDTVVETMGGIHPAFEFIMAALNNKKNVVTANKAVVAAHLDDFLNAAKENGVKFLFEASTGGGIPWLASIQKARRIDDINKFEGIFNGTSNFILDHMTKNNTEFEDALKLAQSLGYAEANPSADIDGYDVQNKVVISSALSFDTYIDIKKITTFPMRPVSFDDIQFFQSKGKTIKYIGEAQVKDDAYEAFVMPNVVENSSVEANIGTNFNITSLYGATIGNLKFYGQGAGMLPTANAIVQDILDIKDNVKTLPIKLDNKRTFSDTMSTNSYVIRTTETINSDAIQGIEEYNGKCYIFTKDITVNELYAVVNPILEKDASAFVTKIRKG